MQLGCLVLQSSDGRGGLGLVPGKFADRPQIREDLIIGVVGKQRDPYARTAQRFDAAVNTVSLGVCLFNANGTLTTSNRRFVA